MSKIAPKSSRLLLVVYYNDEHFARYFIEHRGAHQSVLGLLRKTGGAGKRYLQGDWVTHYTRTREKKILKIKTPQNIVPKTCEASKTTQIARQFSLI